MMFVLLLSVLIGALRPAAEGRPLSNVNGTWQHYQEHSDVTLTFIPVNSTSDLLYIDLMRTEKTWKSIYWYDSKGHPDSYTADEFKGRLQFDPKLVRNGLMECLLSDVRLSDAGNYRWIIATTQGKHLIKFEIRVTKHDQVTTVKVEAEDDKHQIQEEPQTSTQRGRLGLYPVLGLFVVVLLIGLRWLIVKFCNCHPCGPPNVK